MMNDDAEIVQDDASDAPDASSESVDQNADDQNADDQNDVEQKDEEQSSIDQGAVEKKDVKKVRKTVQGKVVSDSMSKTLVVETERLVRHPKYHKYMRKYTKYYAHDETEQAAVGDIVELSMCRPLSKLKRWKLKEIIRMAPRDNAPSPEEMARDEMAREFEGGEA